MRIVILSIGTQGDVRPFVALGLGLKQQGHNVCIASGKTCEALVRQHGLDFSPITADFLEIMAKDPRAMQKGLNPFALVKTVRGHLKDMAKDWAEQGKAAVAGADLVIGNGMVSLLAASLAELEGARCVESQLQPVTPCPDIPPMMLKPGSKALPGFLNLGLYQLMREVTWMMLGAAYKQLRHDLGLKPYPWYGPYFSAESKSRKRLLAYSPNLLKPSPHWPNNVKVVGSLQLKEAQQWQAPNELTDFLAAGEPPIYIGFGSMLADDQEQFSQKILQAIEKSGQRAILATGWGGLTAQSSPNIMVIKSAPHDWLLPQVSMAIHHGGAGTTAAAARAGVPSIVVPFFGDQPFWAWCLKEAGAAPAAINRKTFTANELVTAINTAKQPQMRENAKQLGQKMATEDGVTAAINQLKNWKVL